jgi:hypothetical protein
VNFSTINMINLLPTSKNEKRSTNKILLNLACTMPLNLEEQEKLFFENNCSIDPQFI